jgi:ubiquinone biosynthesis monooxygenase Coq7
MLDRAIIEFDRILKNLFHKPVSTRLHPDQTIAEGEFTAHERKHIIGLMRVNHCGEVCAQGLYQGQALSARDKSNQAALKHAADEETEHLAWTEARITQLGGHTSYLNSLFYLGSLALGVSAGLIGDKWNLAFLKETEQQVEKHLTEHLDQLPAHDNKSRAILEQMREDEIKHAEMAVEFGAAELPKVVKQLMRLSSKIMTTTTYYI